MVDWFKSTTNYSKAVETVSATLNAQTKVLQSMSNDIDLTYPGAADNKIDKFNIVTAPQIKQIFDTISSAEKYLAENKFFGSKEVEDQLKIINKEKVEYLVNIVNKIANESSKGNSVGMYLRKDRLNPFLNKLNDHTAPTDLDETVKGSLLNVAKKKENFFDPMSKLNYGMIAQECTVFAETIKVLKDIADTFKAEFSNATAKEMSASLKIALNDNLFTETYSNLLDTADAYVTKLAATDNLIVDGGKRAGTDTGVEGLSNIAFYNKYIAEQFKKIAACADEFTTISNEILKNAGATEINATEIAKLKTNTTNIFNNK
jgi:hypothetical protein